MSSEETLPSDFDVFAHATTVHNVLLVDVQPTPEGKEQWLVFYEGKQHQLLSPSPWNEQFSRRDVGKFGYVELATNPVETVQEGARYFRAYVDQSLRRVPELDSSQRTAGCEPALVPSQQCVVGWRCDTQPNGFRAPVGLIPGEHGFFVPDTTVEVTLRVPPEFVRECRRYQMTPSQLLRSFVGDLAGIQNFVRNPRADGYGSNGSDERDFAEQWVQRAYGHLAIDIEDLESREIEDEEKQWQADDFAALLDDFEHHGGKREDLIATVTALVEKQAAGSKEV